jgi:hypothetical protein
LRLPASWLAGLAALPLVACGSETTQRGFTADGFVEAANQHGADLVLGDPLPYQQTDAELWGVTFAEHGPEAADHTGHEHAHGSGTLAVFPGVSAALADYEKCQAGGLQCYRADNVSIAFLNAADRSDLQRLSTAFESLAAR